MAGRLLRIKGKLQREGIVSHVIANKIDDISYFLDTLGDATTLGEIIEPSRDNADEAKRPVPLRERDGAKAQNAKNPLAREKARRDISGYYGGGARHPREQAKKLFQSRDFH